MKKLIIIVSMMACSSVFAQNTQWFYNYSNVPVAPVVAPVVVPPAPTPRMPSPTQQYRVPGYTVIQSGGQQAVCVNQGRMITCY